MSDEMNILERESLSAVIDGEANERVMLGMSRRLSRDTEIRDTLIRYQMIGDCLRGEEVDPRVNGIVTAVSRRLAEEPTVLSPGKKRHRPRWLQPAAGAAIAASVAAMGIFLGPRFISQSEPEIVPKSGDLQVVAQPIGDVAPAPSLVSHRETRWKTLENQTQSRLDRYLEKHSQYATQGGVQGVMPYTSFVSYDGSPRK